MYLAYLKLKMILKIEKEKSLVLRDLNRLQNEPLNEFILLILV